MPKIKKTNARPLVSIVIPVYNDEDFLGRALDSCINQTLLDIEIICVDDASTDGSREVVKEYIKKDSRIKLIEQPKNMSALQARKAGVEEARGEYILSLDGDDELDEKAVELSYIKALKYGADVVQFGVKIPPIKGRNVEKFEESLMPKHGTLVGSEIIAKLFSQSGYIRGQTGGYLLKASLLKKTYKYISINDTAYRANDQIITFSALAQADLCVSIKKQLYVYHLADGNSSHKNIDYNKFLFYASAIDSIKLLGTLIDKINIPKNRTDVVSKSYDTLRIFIISGIAGYAAKNVLPVYREKAIDYVVKNIDAMDIILGIGSFKPNLLSNYIDRLLVKKSKRDIKHVALLSTALTTGGLSGVLISQARYLVDAGYKVTIYVNKNDVEYEIPKQIRVIAIDGVYRIDKMKFFINNLSDNSVDAIINHSVFYNTTWAPNMIAARLLGVETIGWIHSFSLRNAHDMNLKGSYLRMAVNTLDRLVVLSKKDVAYWKILGYKRVYYLPNPPSPLLLDFPAENLPKKPPKEILKILWFGRLQQSTKRVNELLGIASHLLQSTDNFKISIVGPESDDLTYDKLQKRIDRRGLSEVVELTGPKRGRDLIKKMNESHIFMYTSDIEGYPLVLTEAQAHGLPVFMYDLPWLAMIENNSGLRRVEWGNANEMAQEVLKIFNSPKDYIKMSTESIKAASHYMSYDFKKLYKQLLSDDLGNEMSPQPIIEDAKMFIEWYEKYNETNAVKFMKLEERHEYLKEKEKAARRQLRAEKSKHILLRKSYAYKIGRRIIKPIKKTRKVIIKVRNQF